MKKMPALILFLLFLPFQAYAFADENHTLYLTIINQTNKILQFKQVISSKPGNQFSIDKHQLPPNDTAIVTAEALIANDILGKISFSDELGNLILLRIFDQEQRHIGQPVFVMTGENIHSIVL